MSRIKQSDINKVLEEEFLKLLFEIELNRIRHGILPEWMRVEKGIWPEGMGETIDLVT